MTNDSFGARTTAAEIVSNLDLSDRVILVTGANTGIGFDTARALAGAGARVILACRDMEKSRTAADRILEMSADSRVVPLALDLASARSILAAAGSETIAGVDTLICNAGLVASNFAVTRDGLEQTVGVCHFGHFLLVKLLLDELLALPRSRVVLVSSESHRSPRTIDFSNFPLDRDRYSMWTAYGQAKLANVMFAHELHRRHAAQGLVACSLHPGTLVTTDIGRGSAWMRLAMRIISPFTKSPGQGAATSVWAATHEPGDELGGKYLRDCRIDRASDESADAESTERLWEISDEWCDNRLTRLE